MNTAIQNTRSDASRIAPPPLIPLGATGPTPGSRLGDIMEHLVNGSDLSPLQANLAFSLLMDGRLTPAQAGALLLGLRAKGESPAEVAEAVKVILDRAVPVDLPPFSRVIDIVGTGGDKRNSFNCSTATALMLAAMGHTVLKHGNRSISSRCGSADVLQQLGLPIELPSNEVPLRLEQDGFAFLFAPRYHPSFQHVMPVRRELGVRTLFNLIGPLVNPARPGISFLGAPDEKSMRLLAGTLARLGSRTGAVVCGAGGYDELTTLGPAKIAFVNNSEVRYGELNPTDFGFSPCTPEELAIGSPEEGASVLLGLLDGKGPAPMRDMLALNVGFGLYLLQGQDMAHCMEEARRALDSGIGIRYLSRIQTR